MLITTHRFGIEEQVEVAEADILDFQPGLLGFDQLHRFVIIEEVDSPVEWLQSVDDPRVAFAMLDPFTFCPDYGFELPDADAAALGLEAPQDAQVRAILAVRESAQQITANLMAPVILNKRAHMGRQIVLQDSDWPLRFPVFEAVAQDAAEGAIVGADRVSAA